VALLILKEVFNFLKMRRNGDAPMCLNLECQRRIREMHEAMLKLVWIAERQNDAKKNKR